ncbi:MAG: hypothetical protein SF187_21535 [Deltaproteobacteria bacterium]|nr:hypothetical protein [Deltaproteobacteria bacterium]
MRYDLRLCAKVALALICFIWACGPTVQDISSDDSSDDEPAAGAGGEDESGGASANGGRGSGGKAGAGGSGGVGGEATAGGGGKGAVAGETGTGGSAGNGGVGGTGGAAGQPAGGQASGGVGGTAGAAGQAAGGQAAGGVGGTGGSNTAGNMGNAGAGGAAAPLTIPVVLKGRERILWVGNSFSEFFGPVSSAVNALLKAATPSIADVTFVEKGKGMGILQEYYEWTSLGVLDAIEKGDFDYVVIQSWEDAISRSGPEVWENGEKNPNYAAAYETVQANFVKYVGLFKKAIESAGAKMILYQPHVSNWDWEAQYPKSQMSHAKARDAYPDLIVFSTLSAWDQVRKDYPTSMYRCAGDADRTVANPDFISLLYSDCGHQNGMGMALDAFTLYSLFTGGRSAEGLVPVWPGDIGKARWDVDRLPYLAKVGHMAAQKAMGTASP